MVYPDNGLLYIIPFYSPRVFYHYFSYLIIFKQGGLLLVIGTKFKFFLLAGEDEFL
jgi:hypothetical protein